MSKIFKDYSKIDLSTSKGRKAFLGAIQHSWDVMGTAQKAMQVREFVKGVPQGNASYATSGENFDVDADILNVIERYHVDIRDIDTNYEAAFTILDLASSKKSSFTIRDVSSGLTFQKTKDGMKAKVYAVSGDEVTVPLDLYSGGLDWQKTWFEDGEWWDIETNAIEFRKRWFTDKATNIYNLIQAITDSAASSYTTAGGYTNSGGINISYDTEGSTEVDKDRNSINGAAFDIITENADGGLGVTADTRLVLLCPLRMKSRILRAFDASYGRRSATDEGAVSYNITPYFTHHISTSDTWADEGTGGNAGTASTSVPLGYMAIPGKKNKIGMRMPLTIFAEDNILTYSTTTVGWGRYGTGINEAQWRRLLAKT